MKHIKKGLTLLITLSMLLLLIPCSNVFAKQENIPTLFIAYDCKSVEKDENIIIEYQYQDPAFKTVYKTYDYTQGETRIVEVDEGNLSQFQQNKVNEFNNIVEVTYVPDTYCFTMNIKDGKTLNIKSFRDNNVRSLINCYGQLKITGSGTINVTLVEEPAEPQPLLLTFNSADITTPALVVAKGNLDIGDDNSSLKMNIGVDISDDYLSVNGEMCGISAESISVKNTTLNINSKNVAFECRVSNSLDNNQDVLLIDKSKVTFNNIKLNAQDTELRKCSLINLSSKNNANVTVKDSTLKININDSSDDKTLVEENDLITLSDTGNFNIINSTLDYYSNAKTSLCSTLVLNIENCNNIKCVNDYYDCIFNVAKFELTDSNFDIKSTGQIFVVRVPLDSFQGPLGKDIAYSSYVVITENSSNYTGKMEITGNGDRARIFPTPTTPAVKLSAPAGDGPYDVPYKYIEISSKTNDLLNREYVNPDGGSLNDYSLNDEGYYIFKFVNGEDQPSKLAWKSFELTYTPVPISPTKHEVLNTGIN